MNSFLKTIFISSVFLSPALSATEVKKSLRIMPGKIHESCLVLATNESIKYAFKTTSAIAFNIHYHLGEQVKYPVKINSATHKSATFKATLKQHYCLMWTNNSTQPTQLEYNYQKN